MVCLHNTCHVVVPIQQVIIPGLCLPSVMAHRACRVGRRVSVTAGGPGTACLSVCLSVPSEVGPADPARPGRCATCLQTAEECRGALVRARLNRHTTRSSITAGHKSHRLAAGADTLWAGVGWLSGSQSGPGAKLNTHWLSQKQWHNGTSIERCSAVIAPIALCLL